MTPAPRLRLAFGCAVVAMLLAAGCGSDDAPDAAATSSTTASDGVLRGMRPEPVPVVSSVSLPDASQGGADFAFKAEDGGLLLVYFGYTHCPDVCPTTMADVRTALELLGDDAGRVDLAMATIDPARDTGDVLTDYVQAFVPGAHALVTEDDATLRAATDAFGAEYEVDATGEGEPEVAHTGFLYAVDDEGHLLVRWPFGTSAEDMAHDADLLLAGA